MPTLLFTGQHPRLDPAEYGLAQFRACRLECAGEENPHAHVGRVAAAVMPLLLRPPDLLVVQGDTSSALGAALAAFTAGVPVAHVEAGLRSHDPTLPWPEEEYRTAIDAGADLLFAPTDTAASNLRAEAVPGTIHVTGNTGIDALLEVEAQAPPVQARDSKVKRLLVTCHRRESWGQGLRSIATAVARLADRDDVQIEVVLHPNGHASRSLAERLDGHMRIELIPPCNHAALIGRMRGADLILSDSGGIQEEAPALGVPLLVLRDKTERPEGINSGNALLVGTSADPIVDAASRLLDDPAELAKMARRTFPYGDGRAAPRIAAVIESWLEANKRSGIA